MESPPVKRPPDMSRVLYWRRQRGLTQQQLAAATGLSEKTIERFDQKRAANPRIGSLLAISRVLRVPLSELIESEWEAQEGSPPDQRQ